MIWGSIIVNRIGKATHFVVRNLYSMIIYQKTISWNEVTKPVSKDFFDVIPLEIFYNILGGIVLVALLIFLEKYL